jgi:hypothetical protein
MPKEDDSTATGCMLFGVQTSGYLSESNFTVGAVLLFLSKCQLPLTIAGTSRLGWSLQIVHCYTHNFQLPLLQREIKNHVPLQSTVPLLILCLLDDLFDTETPPV